MGVDLRIGENHGGEVAPALVRCFLSKHGNNFDTVATHLASDTAPMQIREVELDLSLNEFLGLLKRFNVTLTRTGLDLKDREYRTS